MALPTWRNLPVLTVLAALGVACAESPVTGPPVAERLALLTPAAGPSGLPFSTPPVVAVHDAHGDVVPVSGVVVSLQVLGAASLTGTLDVATIDGVATFTDAGISGSGTFTLSYTAPGLEAIGQAITPTPGTPTRVVLQRAAAGAAAGVPLETSPVVRIEDAAGNLVPATLLVSCWLVRQDAPADTVLWRSVRAVAGVAAFDGLTYSGVVGSHTVLYGAGALDRVAQALDVVAGPASSLRFVVSPRGATVGVALPVQPMVALADRYGNAATGAFVVTASVDKDGVVAGTTSVPTIDGFAAFTDLAIEGTPGTIYSLSFGSGTLSPTAQSLPVWAQGSDPMPSHVSILWPSDPPCCPGNALSIGQQVPLTALVLDQFAMPLQVEVTWMWYNWIGPPSFSTPRISVSGAGLVTALSPGSAQILVNIQIGEETIGASTSVHVRSPD